ncbi:MAG: orotate phosphoribosyltransferase [Nitrosopumilus sp. B06]|nr:MAG: orotate phosphoribosyltransferase [Nitrosopumilus sp. D6]RNJ80246.1 MAG: orotate phosphoribosyltransferase [Nitrosopumilus sp. B06]
MEFVKEFAIFLYKSGIMRFGDYTLASGKKSPYYVDLRQVPGHPHEFRQMIKHLRGMIAKDGFADSIASVPTGGTIIAAALAVESVMPLVYVRAKPKEYGTSRRVEGVIRKGSRAVMVDDVATTGGSVADAIAALSDEGIAVSDAYVIVDRLEGASERLAEMGTRLHSVLDVRKIAQILGAEGLVEPGILEKFG